MPLADIAHHTLPLLTQASHRAFCGNHKINAYNAMCAMYLIAFWSHGEEQVKRRTRNLKQKQEIELFYEYRNGVCLLRLSNTNAFRFNKHMKRVRHRFWYRTSLASWHRTNNEIENHFQLHFTKCIRLCFLNY